MSAKKILLGLAAGAAIGTALAILLAPDKGAATRKKIMDMADDYASDLKEKVNDGFKAVASKFENLAEAAKDGAAKRESKNVL